MYAYDYSNDAYRTAQKVKAQVDEIRAQMAELYRFKEKLETVYNVFTDGFNGQVLVRTNNGWVWLDLEKVLVDPTEH